MTSDAHYRIEEVRDAETAARAVLLADRSKAAAQETARLRAEVAELTRRVQAAEALATDLAGRKAIRVAEAIQGRRRSVTRGRRGASRESAASVASGVSGMSDREHGARSPVFTIVIPVYNNGSTLRAALDSVRNQTMPNWEVILWDDGSTDPETVALLDSLDLPNVRKFREVNQGVVRARNSRHVAGGGEFTRSSWTRMTRSSRPILRRPSSPSRGTPMRTSWSP